MHQTVIYSAFFLHQASKDKRNLFNKQFVFNPTKLSKYAKKFIPTVCLDVFCHTSLRAPLIFSFEVALTCSMMVIPFVTFRGAPHWRQQTTCVCVSMTLCGVEKNTCNKVHASCCKSFLGNILLFHSATSVYVHYLWVQKAWWTLPMSVIYIDRNDFFLSFSRKWPRLFIERNVSL